MNTLPPLNNIINNIKIDDDHDLFQDVRECLYLLLEEYLEHNIDVYKYENFEEQVKDNLHDYFEEIYPYELLNLDIDYIIEETMHMYFIINSNPRSYNKTCIIKKNNKKKNKKILNSHLKKEQPDQRTKEWYEFRHNRLTASDFYKIFDTQSKQNDLILKKCKPIDISKYNTVNTDSAFHHGHLFEPLSILLYEKKYKTKVGEFGCISHDKYQFLGASPDGINIDESNERYCRLVEVKNPKSRIISGIPKKEYWIQMQLQMEVWNLDECDFLETTFHQYENEDEFLKDGTFTLSNDCKEKGIIVQFYDGKEPIYEYAPIGLTQKEFDNWYDACMEKNNTLTWIRNIYWKIDVFSCVLVTRNKAWFESKVPTVIDFWNTILHDRKNGYEHRKPKKREKKPKQNSETVVIKIRTQSFDETNNLVTTKESDS